jgi:hypothetical protein
MNGGSDSSSSAVRKIKSEKEKNTPKVLNIDARDQSLWLVKVPQFVAERWATAESDDIVGSLSVSAKPGAAGGPPVKQLNVTLNRTDGSVGPDTFTLDELKSSSDNFIAISADGSKGFCVDGKVTKNMVLKPQINEEYRQLIRERGLSNVANRKEIGLANMKEIERTSTQSHTVEFITSDRMELKRKAAAEKALLANKASRGNTEGETAQSALRSRVFEAFEKTDKLTFKDIFSYCSDVAGFSKEKDLRDLLEVYATYHHRGTYKHFWELKPEYRGHFGNTEEKDGME